MTLYGKTLENVFSPVFVSNTLQNKARHYLYSACHSGVMHGTFLSLSLTQGVLNHRMILAGLRCTNFFLENRETLFFKLVTIMLFKRDCDINFSEAIVGNRVNIPKSWKSSAFHTVGIGHVFKTGFSNGIDSFLKGDRELC